jgi:biotin carboxyl carrier protein
MKYDVIIDGRSASLQLEDPKAGQGFRFEVEGSISENETTEVREAVYSMEAVGEDKYSVLVDGRSFAVSVLSGGEISVDGRVYKVDVFDPRSLRSRGAAGHSEGRQVVAAPMPGRVIRVLVEVGQDVEAGQGLIVVEAMKMQNEMKSPKVGKVAEVRTSTGATVAAGETLVVIE